MKWLLLIISLPTENATTRMRAWRTLKASGAAVLRDGVYLLPDRPNCLSVFEQVAADVQTDGGTAQLLMTENATTEHGDQNFVALFDRREQYAALMQDISAIQNQLNQKNIQDAVKQLRKLRKSFTALIDIDYFPGEAQKQTDTALQELEVAVSHILSPDEPQTTDKKIKVLQLKDYKNRVWITRQRPWVDRLASAWLIRRYIDPKAKILWLESPADYSKDALGFDYDGATFTHVGAKVTFEVLMASFGLEQHALKQIGTLVHYLDVGGIQPAEASGLESILSGLKETIADDDKLFAMACHVFDALLTSFEKQESTP